MSLHFFEYAAIPFLILTYIKIIEMYYHQNLVGKGVKNSYSKLPISPKVARIPIIYWLFFKLPTLIIVLSLLGYVTHNNVISWTIAATLLIVLWVLVGRMIYDLLYQGSNRYLSNINSLTLALIPQPLLSKEQQIRSFTFTLFFLVGLIIIGYSTIFYVCHSQFGKKSFYRYS